MDQNSTQDLLVKKAYSEISILEELELDSLLTENETLEFDFKKLLDVKNVLDHLDLSPNPTSVKLILEESMRSSHLETH